MADIEIKFTSGAPCPGGNHLDITAEIVVDTVVRKTLTKRIDANANQPVEIRNEAILQIAERLIDLIDFRLSSAPPGNRQGILNGKTINIWPPV